MKFYLRIIAWVLVPCSLSAQEPLSSAAKRKFEAGINAGSLIGFDRHPFKITFQDFIPGIFLKYHFNKNILRSSFDYSASPIHKEYTGDYSYYKNDGKQKEFSSTLGYEQRFGKKRLMISIFLDASFLYYQSQRLESYCGCFGCYKDLPYYIIRKSFMLSAGAGLNYQITKRLNLVYEFAAQESISYEKNIRAEKIRTRNYRNRPAFSPLYTFGAGYLF